MIRPEDVILDETGSLDNYGHVYRARLTNLNQVVAVKILSGDAAAQSLSELIKSWEKLNHPNVLRILGVSDWQYADPSFIVSEYHAYGEATQFLRENPLMNKSHIVLDIALGMQYLHSRSIIHGGLKTSDVLITSTGRACVADYGLSTVQSSRSKDAHRYFSPEAWNGVVSRPSDVYAFAMCALELFSSALPWGVLSKKNIYNLVVHEDARPDRPQNSQELGLTDQIWTIIEESWHSEARFRPAFDIIVKSWPDGKEETPGRLTIQRSISLVTRPRIAESRGSPPAYQTTDPSPLSPTNSIASSFLRIRPLPEPPLETSPTTLWASSSTEHTSISVSSPDSPLIPTFARSLSQSESLPHLVPSSAPPSVKSFPNRISIVRKTPSLRSRRPHTISGNLPGRSVNRMSRTFAGMTSRSYMGSISENEGTVVDDFGGRSCKSHTDNPILLANALQAEVKDGQNNHTIDEHLHKVYQLASQSEIFIKKFIAANTIPTLISMLTTRAVSGEGHLLPVMIVLGTLAHDTISANTIYRSGTTATLVELFQSPSDTIAALAAWCLIRVCRTSEIVSAMIKRGLPKQLLKHGVDRPRPLVARYAAWCLGNLIHSDSVAESLLDSGHVHEIAEYLHHCTNPALSFGSTSEDVCAALFLVARMSRSIKLAKALTKAGCVKDIAAHLNSSVDPDVLNWSARSAGCLMRPNSSDMAKVLLDANIARGLARMPNVLPTDRVLPLASFAFAVQRFSCAEWGSGTRKALVEAGVTDSLLAALRTAAYEPYPRVHIELALAISFLGDVGGSAIRKEIMNAGGLTILKNIGVAAGRGSEVSKICNLAVVSISGNILTRNAASARTAFNHVWNGGCPEHHPPCPVRFDEETGHG
ncbi:hypothetical protein WG66_016930 [Moniliophthora roreri]|uniref:Protein kinase domain-containing protein n=1 Tax=Moniliophthora roreri TaxID=221103 RepID=A0A0W0FMT0_MONRR|nr:hypothetical protein WG66_016930 [Moniliophthora roreri]